MKKDEILLESGTGELEILHFIVKNQHYAINVVKVKELLEIEKISKVPNSHDALSGVTLIRGDVISVVDLLYVLEHEYHTMDDKNMTLVCEFNQLKVGFVVDKVLGISRIKWSEISEPDNITTNSLVIGNIRLNGEILMLLDFEKIIMDINPETGISEKRIEKIEEKDRKKYRILLADDSPLIRKVLTNTLRKAGFEHLTFFNDGLSTYNYLENLYEDYGKGFTDHVDLLITDIEMPKLDGHTLTRMVKEHKDLKSLPVVIFSSLITEDLLHKGESVGADAQMSKPQIDKLIELVDELLMN